MIFILLSILTLALAPTPASTVPANTAPVATLDAAPAADPFHRASFDLRVGDGRIPYDVMAAFVLPGEELPLEVAASKSAFTIGADSGTVRSLGSNQWTWTAPEQPGVYPVRVAGPTGETVVVNVFVMVPYDRMKNGRIAGYRIGSYPERWSKAKYERPRGFVEVNASNQDVLVGPHFKLGQFICKQGTGYPKFVVLRQELVVKLERLLEAAHTHGFEASTFQLMSAYRTPVYNLGIGNKTTFSRHQYGDAADIFIDQFPADGRMDDLNRDGRGDHRDATLLSRWAEDLEKSPEGEDLVGGLSAYGSTEGHGPFVHVDTRGYAARW